MPNNKQHDNGKPKSKADELAEKARSKKDRAKDKFKEYRKGKK